MGERKVRVQGQGKKELLQIIFSFSFQYPAPELLLAYHPDKTEQDHASRKQSGY
jgi:hypothetical protein